MNQTSQKFPDPEVDMLTATECKDHFKIKHKEVLLCIPCDERPNAHGYKNKMKLYKYEDVLGLVCKREAILAGESPEKDEEKLLARGREIWEAREG